MVRPSSYYYNVGTDYERCKSCVTRSFVHQDFMNTWGELPLNDDAVVLSGPSRFPGLWETGQLKACPGVALDSNRTSCSGLRAPCFPIKLQVRLPYRDLNPGYWNQNPMC